MRQAIPAATDVGCSAAAGAGFPATVERRAAGAAAVPAAGSRCRPATGLAAPAADAHSQGLARSDRELGGRPSARTGCARGPRRPPCRPDSLDANPAGADRHQVVPEPAR